MAEREDTTVQSNIGQQDYNIIQLRLDTQKLHKDLSNFLEGKTQILQLDAKTGNYTEVDIAQGEPLANPKGRQSLLSFIVATVNSHTVQGNLEKEEYNELMYFIYDQLGQELTLNCKAWEIESKQRRHIQKTIVTMLQLFLSRTIGDKERDSLRPFTKETSHVVTEERKKLLGVI